MITAINQRNFNIYYRITGHNSVFHGFNNTCFYRRYKFFGNSSTYNLILKLKATALFKRLNIQNHMSVLSTATTLPNKLSIYITYFSANGLPVSNLWLANICIYFKLQIGRAHV